MNKGGGIYKENRGEIDKWLKKKINQNKESDDKNSKKRLWRK